MDGELAAERLANDVAAVAATPLDDAVELTLELGIQADGDRCALHVLHRSTKLRRFQAYSPTGHTVTRFLPARFDAISAWSAAPYRQFGVSMSSVSWATPNEQLTLTTKSL